MWRGLGAMDHRRREALGVTMRVFKLDFDCTDTMAAGERPAAIGKPIAAFRSAVPKEPRRNFNSGAPVN